MAGQSQYKLEQVEWSKCRLVCEFLEFFYVILSTLCVSTTVAEHSYFIFVWLDTYSGLFYMLGLGHVSVQEGETNPGRRFDSGIGASSRLHRLCWCLCLPDLYCI